VVPVTFEISDPAKIVAVANANPKDVASFRQPRCNTFHGTCLVIVESSKPFDLRADSPGLESARLQAGKLQTP